MFFTLVFFSIFHDYGNLFPEYWVYFFSLFCRAWREKLEKAEIRKMEETKDLQVIVVFFLLHCF